MITQKSKTKYSKILVTGGAGFIGTNLCTRLLNETASEVICLDNLRTGKEENIEKFKKHIIQFHSYNNQGDNSIHEENGKYFTVTKEFFKHIKFL